MLNEENVKQEIKNLVYDFRQNYQKYKSELEANTETKLIEPLFELLGWTKKDFVKRESAHRGVKRGFADYAFYINGRIVFFLEVKRVGVYLDREADTQVVSYALSKRVPFAVSTNFEQLKIFCVEQENAINKVFRVFNKPEDYISEFHDLLLLSKQNFEGEFTLQKAESEGRLKKRISIDKPLLEDLMHIRNLIANDIEKNYPGKYNPNEKDDIIQRIIDRLIFIRRCEDTGINPDNIALEEIRALPHNKAYPRLKEIFLKYNAVYNSGLFLIGVDNDCDSISINGEIIKNLISYLYKSRDGQYIYNFDWIDADVLGQVYEQYLGKILQQKKSGKSELLDDQIHRKEQGVYYTPVHIVDYIVKNTVGEILKNTKIKDASKIRVLDPACGSGSFLIKAYDILNDYYKKNDENYKQTKLDFQNGITFTKKVEILQNNIFGVDLDSKAVEISQLNLLLKIAEGGHRLPILKKNIRCGNSLIDDENIAGLNAFKWKEKFSDIMNDGFDVIIGNPPYGVEFTTNEKNYFRKVYKTVSSFIDSYILFIERATKLLKKNGILGFIVPESWLTNPSNTNLREYLIRNFSILQIVDIPGMVFSQATVDTVIIIIKNSKPINNKTKIFFVDADDKLDVSKESEINQYNYLDLRDFCMNTIFDETIIKLIKKIETESIKLKEISKNTRGIETGNNKKFLSKKKENKEYLPLITGDDIKRYSTPTNKYFVKYGKELSNPKTLEIFKGHKIILQRIKNQNLKRRLVAAIDRDNRLILDSVHMVYDIQKPYHPYYLLALLNSKLLNFYFKLFSLYPRINAVDLDNLPIKKPTNNQEKLLVNLVDKTLNINLLLEEIGDKKTAKREKLEEEIKLIDMKIDEIIYEIYGIDNNDKTIIENKFK